MEELTLLDYFAAKLAAAILSNPAIDLAGAHKGEITAKAYEFAHDMMRQRAHDRLKQKEKLNV